MEPQVSSSGGGGTAGLKLAWACLVLQAILLVLWGLLLELQNALFSINKVCIKLKRSLKRTVINFNNSKLFEVNRENTIKPKC